MKLAGCSAVVTGGASGLGAATVRALDTPLLARVADNVRAALGASVPFPKRLGVPEEFASLVLEMCRNSYFNGEDVRLDGAIRMAPR